MNIEQQRAEYAYRAIQRMLEKSTTEQKQLKAYIESLPSMIQSNGFGQAIAFYVSHKESRTGGKAYQQIVADIRTWLIGQQYVGRGEFMGEICSASMANYQLATAETQSLLIWFKKFARAYLKTDVKEA